MVDPHTGDESDVAKEDDDIQPKHRENYCF